MTESLIEALTAARISGNHSFISSMAERVGFSAYEAKGNGSKPYIIAHRRDGGRTLKIYHGYTMGFGSRDEIIALLGETVLPEYDEKTRIWWIRHPDNGIGERSERVKNTSRVADFCSCGMQRSLAGGCDSCD
jgi:hypothetical protein